MQLILIIIVICAILYVRLILYWKLRKVKTLPINPLFGHLTDVILRKIPVHELFTKAYKEGKTKGYKYIGFFLFWKPALVALDPDLVKKVLTKDFGHFTDREFHLNKKTDPLSSHLVSMRGKDWKHMRDTLSPVFTPSKLKTTFQTMSVVGEELVSVLDKAAKEEEAVDLKDVNSRYTVDIIGMYIFGIECNTLKNLNLQFRTYANKIVGGSFVQNFKFFLCLVCPSVMDVFHVPFIALDVRNFYINVTTETIQHRESSTAIRRDMMQSLIQLRNNMNIEKDVDNLDHTVSETKCLSIEEIASETMMFSAASYETSVNTATFCIIELLCNEVILNKVKDEVRTISQKYDGDISYACLAEMAYLEMCVYETLRKYPQLSILSRICTRTFPVPETDLVIEKGTVVYIPVIQIHSDPEYYPNPEKYDPDRFLLENKRKRPPYTFLSFGEGPRNCIGLKLGVLQVKLFLALVIKNYNISINSKTKSLLTFSDSTSYNIKGPFLFEFGESGIDLQFFTNVKTNIILN